MMRFNPYMGKGESAPGEGDIAGTGKGNYVPRVMSDYKGKGNDMSNYKGKGKGNDKGKRNFQYPLSPGHGENCTCMRCAMVVARPLQDNPTAN